MSSDQNQNVPEVVNYTVLGRTAKALVLSARHGEVSHVGAKGEPLLTLAIVKQALPAQGFKRPNVLQTAVTTPETEVVHDVVHASHKFSAKFKEDKGIKTDAEIVSHRGHGEWSEVAETADDAGLGVEAAPPQDV